MLVNVSFPFVFLCFLLVDHQQPDLFLHVLDGFRNKKQEKTETETGNNKQQQETSCALYTEVTFILNAKFLFTLLNNCF